MPAIKLACGIEKKIDNLIDSGQENKANLSMLSFIEGIEEANAVISIGIETNDIEKTLLCYIDLLTTIDHLLFERKNILLPRQANIFTTNYDTFIEEAASRIPTLFYKRRL